MTTTQTPNTNPTPYETIDTTKSSEDKAHAGSSPLEATGPSDNRASVPIERFAEYHSAELLVDRLSDGGFPIGHVTIVGENLRSVEYVTGRRTITSAAAAGANQGAWMGFAMFLLFAVITPWAFGALILALVVPVAVGAAFNATEHALRRGRRDFDSIRRVEAGSYAVMVTATWADAARSTLGIR